MTTRSVLLWSVVAAVLAAILAPPASADRYVSKTGADNGPCLQPADPCRTIGWAVGEATAGETIHVGPGTFTEELEVDKRLHLAGSGTGQTALAGPNGLPGLRLSDGGGVRAMRIVGGYADGYQTGPAPALVLDPAPHYAIDDVVLVGGLHEGSSGTSSGTALYVTGSAAPAGTIEITGSRLVQEHGTSGWYLMRVGPSATVVADDLTLTPIGGIAQVHAKAGLDLSRATTTRAAAQGISIDGEGEVTLSRSRLVAEGTALGLASQNGLAKATVRDSLLVTSSPQPYAAAIAVRASYSLGSQAEVILEGSTVAARGRAPLAARIDADNAGAARLTSTGSVLRSYDTALQQPGRAVRAEGVQGGVATFAATHSAFGEAVAYDAASVTAAGTGTNVSAEPRFADEAGGDYLPAPGSPLVDAGAAATPLDLAGAPRSLDGDGRCGAQPDIGALERPALPDAGCPAPPAAALLPVLRHLRLDDAKLARGERTFARWRLSAAATVRLSVERKAGTRWKTVLERTVRGKAGPGKARLKSSALTKGRYRLRAVPRTADGLRGVARTTRLRIVAR